MHKAAALPISSRDHRERGEEVDTNEKLVDLP